MDIIIYVGIAVLLAIVLFVALGGKKAEPKEPESAERELPGRDVISKDAAKPKPAEAGAVRPATRAPSERDARDKGVAEPGKKVDRSAVDDGAAPVGRALDEDVSLDEGQRYEPEPPSAPVPPDLLEPRPRELESLREGLAKSRESGGFFGKLKALFTRKGDISPAIVEEVEEVLLASDVGVATTQELLSSIREQLHKGDLKDQAAVWAALRSRITQMLSEGNATPGLTFDQKPTVVLMVGVNGAGKTTTIGKLATHLTAQGKKCVLAAGDTFRAAAVQQLVVWGDRVGCEVVRGKDGSDPGSVIFDAIKRAQELGADVVLADTAGRLHTKRNLMAEMQKIARTAGKAMEGAPHETLLVIDATTGQNAVAQAEEFKEKLGLTGIVLTKLDGTAKGGVVLGIVGGLKVPVRFIGLGERPDDLHSFVVNDFVDALLDKDVDGTA